MKIWGYLKKTPRFLISRYLTKNTPATRPGSLKYPAFIKDSQKVRVFLYHHTDSDIQWQQE